jgi:dihydrofolate reductase
MGEKINMNMIAAVDANWAIGRNGQLLVRIPNDHKHFRTETMGKVVVYGRKTLQTFPQGMPLEGRTNVILSRQPGYQVKGAVVVSSLEELFDKLKAYPRGDVYVIGGESVYHQLLPYCHRIHITRIDHSYEADAYFPDLDKDPEWEITADSDEQTYFDIAYTFLRYDRKKKCCASQCDGI